VWRDERLGRWSRTNALIAAAAERLGARAEELCGVHSDRLVRLVRGERSVIIARTRSPFLTVVAGKLSNNKYVGGELLRARGLPVVERALVEDLGDPAQAACAREALARWGAVVVKPNWRNRALGATPDVKTWAQLSAAVALAVEVDHDAEALIEPQVGGVDLRVSVIGGRVVAACALERPVLVGDGEATVAALVDRLNQDPRRGAYDDGALTPLDRMEPDATWARVLGISGYSMEAVVPAGARIPVLTEESETIDVTDALHPYWAEVARAACDALGVDVGGADLIVESPGSPSGVLLEVNCLPALHLHALPTRGAPRPVFEAFVAWCLGEGPG